MKQIGIDLGTSSIKIAVLEDGTLTRKWSDPHYGDVIPVLLEGLEECGITEGSAKVSVTGGNAPLLYHCLDSSLFCEEIPAILQGAKEQVPDAGCIMEIGSQNSRFLTDLSEKAPRFSASEHCAGIVATSHDRAFSIVSHNASRASLHSLYRGIVAAILNATAIIACHTCHIASCLDLAVDCDIQILDY